MIKARQNTTLFLDSVNFVFSRISCTNSGTSPQMPYGLQSPPSVNAEVQLLYDKCVRRFPSFGAPAYVTTGRRQVTRWSKASSTLPRCGRPSKSTAVSGESTVETFINRNTDWDKRNI